MHETASFPPGLGRAPRIRDAGTANRRSSGRTWLAATVLSVLMHLALTVAVLTFRPFTPAHFEPSEPAPIQLVFAEPATAKEPEFFSPLPPEAADERPEEADFLSGVDSRARDLVASAEDRALPRLTGDSDAPHVALVPGERAPSPAEPGSETEPDPAESTPDEAAEMGGPAVAPPTDHGDVAESPRETSGAAASPASSELARLLLLRPPGTADFPQEAMNNPDGGSTRPGGISLNTWAWDYAPWLEWFIKEFHRGWTAPYAYRMGTIDGRHTVRVTIHPDGRLLDLRVIDVEGHESLVETSVLNFRAMAPYKPLPDDFPDDVLIMTWNLIYPPLKRPARGGSE